MVPSVGFAGLVLPTHDLFVGLGVAVALVVFVGEARRRRGEPFAMLVVVTGALVGGAVGERLSGLAARLSVGGPAPLVWAWESGSRSILGGLAGAYAGAVVAKWAIAHRERTGDLFAPAVALGMAVGRIGCLLTEAPGRPTTLPWGVHAPGTVPACPGCAAGLAMHPSFAYEIVFQLFAFAALRWLRPRVDAPGELLTIYLAGYAAFRFAVEFVRADPVMLAGLTGPQCFLVLCSPWLVSRLVRRGREGVFDALLPHRAAGRGAAGSVP